MCASPRANHALRTVLPLDIAGYAQAHDDAVWETLQACLGGVASGEADGARKLDSPSVAWRPWPSQRGPYRARSVYWAAWADALPVLGERAPALAEACVRQLEGRDAETACLRSAAVARNLLQAEGWQGARPGEQSRMVPAHQWRLTGASVTGRMAGSTVRRALATYTSASARCYQTCRPAPARSCALKLGRTRVPG